MLKNLYQRGLIFFTIGITFLIFSSATAVQTVHASPTMNALEKEKHFLDEKQHLFPNLNCYSKDSFKKILSKVKSLSENTNHEVKIIISKMTPLIEGKFSESIPMDLNRDFNLWEILLVIFTAIIELTDFLYSVIEPFIVIIFTILYAVNPPLAVLFIIFL